MFKRERLQTLASFLNVSPRELLVEGNKFTLYDQEFLVLTEEEAYEACTDPVIQYIDEMPNSLLLAHAKPGTTEAVLEELRSLGEAGSPGILCLIQDIDAVVQGAVDLYGRGYFLACDEEESEEQDFYIYRLN